MKRIIIYIITLFVVLSWGVAQQTIESKNLQEPPKMEGVPLQVGKSSGLSAAEPDKEYLWQSQILRRFGEQGDTNGLDWVLPYKFTDGTEFRGLGQIFSPQAISSFYANIYTETSDILRSSNPDAVSDKEWLDQLKGALSYTVDSMSFLLYKNPESTPSNPGKITLWRTTGTSLGLTSSSYKTSGINNLDRKSTKLLGFDGYNNKPFTMEVTPEMLEATLDGNNINRTVLGFDPPLKANKNDAIIFMYTNDDAPAVEGGTIPADAEVQRLRMSNEYREGEPREDTEANPIEPYKSMGLFMVRQNGKDLINTFFIYTWGTKNKKYLFNANMLWKGRIELPSGVEYHFGTDANQQGLENVVPSPVVNGKASRQYFSLTERSHVTLQLFDVNGKLVKTMIDNQYYIPGKYSIALPVEELQNGSYMISLKAGDKVYTNKVNVSK